MTENEDKNRIDPPETSQHDCPVCHGEGEVHGSRCGYCKGQGEVRE